MCGIAGLVGRPGDPIDPGDLRQMCQTLIHRGPDDEGIYVKGHAGLGIRRLSIIDVAGGHQPIHNEDQTVWAVVNGEIYNFAALRKELEDRGHRFYTQTDVEVAVHLYEEMGSEFVQRLRGMFAIALYDEANSLLLLARDRLGKKPLHYALQDGRLIFASEIKAMLAAAPGLGVLRPEALLQYFHFGYIADPLTAFAAIEKLPPGHLLEFREGSTRLRRYWDLPAYGTAEVSSEEECLEQLEQQLTEAVRIRLASEVPLGVLLSGGVDSSVVVALMARVSSNPVKTFSIGFAEKEFNEANYARQVSERFATDHTELRVEPQIEAALDSLTRTLEEPFADSSVVPTYYVCQMARRHVTVALSGDGGDELYAGYDRYLVHLARGRFARVPVGLGEYFREHVYPWLPSALRGQRFLFNLSLPGPERYLDSVTHLPVRGRERTIFSSELQQWANECNPAADVFLECFADSARADKLSQLLYVDTKTYLPGDILFKVDRVSMAHSLEIRCPLLDHKVVEWAARLPSSWKLRESQPKYILKKLAERLGVPANVLHRPKKGFAMPVGQWWRNGARRDMLDLLLEPRTLQRGYFNPTAVRQLISEHTRGRRDRSYDIWTLLMFELWHRNFLEATGIPGEAARVGVNLRGEVKREAQSDPSTRSGVECPLKS